MALSDLEIFNENTYSTYTEILDQQVNLFNSASQNAISLSVKPVSGSFNTTSFFQRIANNLVRRRNPFADGAIPSASLTMASETEVKVAAGTKPVRMDEAQFNWIKMNPDIAAAAVSKQMAAETLGDMLNTGLGVCRSALEGESEVYRDITGRTDPDDKVSFTELARTSALLGDRAQDIRAWVMHSAPMHSLFVEALQNPHGLFNFGTVRVVQDGFGRVFVITDSPALAQAGATEDDPLEYALLGLQSNAIRITSNADYNQVDAREPGYDNIRRTFQAEWSFNLGIKGFSYNMAAGEAPADSALFNSANWRRVAGSHKDLAGVMLKAHVDL